MLKYAFLVKRDAWGTGLRRRLWALPILQRLWRRRSHQRLWHWRQRLWRWRQRLWLWCRRLWCRRRRCCRRSLFSWLDRRAHAGACSADDHFAHTALTVAWIIERTLLDACHERSAASHTLSPDLCSWSRIHILVVAFWRACGWPFLGIVGAPILWSWDCLGELQDARAGWDSVCVWPVRRQCRSRRRKRQHEARARHCASDFGSARRARRPGRGIITQNS